MHAWDYVHIDGLGEKRTNLYHYACNASLVSAGLRPSFLVEKGNFNKEYWEGAKSHIHSQLFNAEDPMHLYDYIELDQNILVLPSFTSWVKILDKVDFYEQLIKVVGEFSKNPNDTNLGRVLGFDCASEIPIPKPNFIVTLRLKDGIDIVTQICKKKEKALLAYEKMDEMKNHLDKLRDEGHWPGLPAITLRIIPNH